MRNVIKPEIVADDNVLVTPLVNQRTGVTDAPFTATVTERNDYLVYVRNHADGREYETLARICEKIDA